MIKGKYYTQKEFEKGKIKAVESYLKYHMFERKYNFLRSRTFSNVILEDELKENLNKSVEECEKNIPKSLIDKLEIKKI